MLNLRLDDGVMLDLPYIAQTAVTVTAGCNVWVDVSGTNVVHRYGTVADTGYAGVITETLTGASTGVTIATEGVYEFVCANSTTDAFTGSTLAPGDHVYAVSGNFVRPQNNTANTLTGLHPIGVVTFFPATAYASAATCRVWVKIFPFRQIRAYA